MMPSFVRGLSTGLLVLVLPLVLHGQNSTTSSPPGNASPTTTERAETGVYSGREIYVPKVADKKDPEPTATSFADGFLRNTRHHIGGSVAVTESYTPNLPTSDGTDSLALTSVFPQLFVNFDKKKFDFRLNYGLAYQRIKEGQSELSSSSQNGGAALNYSLSGRRASLAFSNNLTSMYYDQGSYLGMFLTTPYLSGPNLNVSQLFPDRQRLSRGTAGVNFIYRVTKKASVSTGVTYDVARYTGLNPQRANLASGTLGVSYLVNKWLTLTTNYSQNLYSTTQALGTSNIQNLQVGGVSFKLGKGWTLSGSGGVSSTKTNGQRQVAGSGLGTISRRSRSTTIDFTYNRGYSTVFPVTSIWLGDTATVYMLRRLSSRFDVHANASYLRGSALATTSLAHSVYGAVGMDFLPQRNVVISTNYFNVSQKLTDLSFQQPNLHRYTVTVGLTYYLPNLQPEKH